MPTSARKSGRQRPVKTYRLGVAPNLVTPKSYTVPSWSIDRRWLTPYAIGELHKYGKVTGFASELYQSLGRKKRGGQRISSLAYFAGIKKMKIRDGAKEHTISGPGVIFYDALGRPQRRLNRELNPSTLAELARCGTVRGTAKELFVTRKRR